MILRGWKNIASYAKVHPQTARNWHYYRLPIPFFKSGKGYGGKIWILKEAFDLYLIELYKTFYNTSSSDNL